MPKSIMSKLWSIIDSSLGIYLYGIEYSYSITGTNYCPDYYPPSWEDLYKWSGQI